MTRSVWKGPYVSVSLVKQVIKAKIKSSSSGMVIVKTRCRNCVIVPEFVGMIFHVHNGRKYFPVKIIDLMIGKKLGEFSPTRHFTGHSSKVKK